MNLLFDISFLNSFLSAFLNSVLQGVAIVTDLLALIPIAFATMPAIVVSTIILCVGIKIVFNVM